MDARQRQTGESFAVILAVLFPPFGLLWGVFRAGRGDTAFGLAVAAFCALEITVILLLM